MTVPVNKHQKGTSGTQGHRALRFLIAGGGTGGHIFPALAIANALKVERPDSEFLFVGAKGRMEMEKVPQAGYMIKGIDIAGFNRSSLIRNIGLPWKLLKSFLQVRRIVNSYKPDAVIGVGGYSSFPVLRYAQAKAIPTFIHESNSFAGRSNIWLGKKATRVFVATDGMEKFFPPEKITITGNPIRPDIVRVSGILKEEALRSFGLKGGMKTVLVMGGSLGARSINEAVANGFDQILNSGMQLIWQTGKTDSGKWKERAAGYASAWVGEFIADMQYAYAAADIVVSRAGAMSVAELCVVQKPVVFVPFPFAAEDHQTVNAAHLVEKEAAIMVKDSEAVKKVVPVLIALAKDEQRQRILKENIGRQKVTDADKRISNEILKSIGNL